MIKTIMNQKSNINHQQECQNRDKLCLYFRRTVMMPTANGYSIGKKCLILQFIVVTFLNLTIDLSVSQDLF